MRGSNQEQRRGFQFIGELFQTRVLLFIGASLEGLEQDLANLSLPAPAPGPRKHYALVSMAGEGWEERAERLRLRYAIEPLTYSPSTARHPEVVKLFPSSSTGGKDQHARVFRGRRIMRVGIAGLLHESNTFLPRPTVYEDFASTSLCKGGELIERWQGAEHELGGFLQGASELGHSAALPWPPLPCRAAL